MSEAPTEPTEPKIVDGVENTGWPTTRPTLALVFSQKTKPGNRRLTGVECR